MRLLNKVLKRADVQTFLQQSTPYFNRVIDFWRRKTPVGDKYPFEIHTPFSIFGDEKTGYEKLYLVGDNWQDTPEKPIAVVLGCNDWKFGFVAAYLKDYRVAFGSRKAVTLSMAYQISMLSPKPELLVVWGYTETSLFSKHARIRNFKISRMEDGFVRSCELGASHATPYSLVLDKTGLYYNSQGPSDIENIFNTYDFQSNPALLDNAKNALETMIELKVSKYNPPALYMDNTVKIKKRIAILGQVDSDASIRYGNPENWKAETMIRLAAFENPDAEILYRPHPEIYKGYQKSKFKKKRVEYFAKIVSPDENIIDFINRVDHVYTITSLSGLEALLRGKKVTVLGAPFYAGWGLTDDRVMIERRNRQLTLLELFAVSYLLYPRYLANLDNSYVGLMAACYRIQADKFIALDDLAKLDPEVVVEKYPRLLKTYKWVGVLRNPHTLGNPTILSKVLKMISFNEIFEHRTGHMYPSVMAYFLVGLMPTEQSKDEMLMQIRPYVDAKHLNQLLLDLEEYFSGSYLSKHWVWLLSELGENAQALNIVANKIRLLKVKFENQTNHINELESSVATDFSELATNDENEKSYIKQLCDSINQELFVQIEQRDYEGALGSLKFLLLMGFKTSETISQAMVLFDLMFQYESLKKFSLIQQGLGLFLYNRSATALEFSTSRFLGADPSLAHIVMLSKVLALKPDLIMTIKNNIDLFGVTHANTDSFELITSQLNLDNDLTPRKIQSYIALEKFDKAERMSKMALENDNPTLGALVQYSQALSYNGKIKEAMDMIRYSLSLEMNGTNIKEALRLFVLDDDFVGALDLLQKAERMNIQLGDMYFRKINFGNRLPEAAFKSFLRMEGRKSLMTHFGQKYLDLSLNPEIIGLKNMLLIAVFGPGDEVRFASIYPKLINIFGSGLMITCSPKYYKLFVRAFPKVNFIAVPRIRYSDPINLLDYSLVPGSDIMGFMDNNAIHAANRCDKLLLTTDLLHWALPNYENFTGVSYLQADPKLMAQYQTRLPNGKPLVGISWRSSLTTSARNEHYLSIEQLEPLFAIEGIQFVNFQYDECADEVAWVNARYPGKLINFEDIDQYNDFDSVAALMKCMDLIISPATTVLELAGALGCPSWLFSNSSEIDWRKIDEAGTDVWHHSVSIVDCAKKGDKDELVNELHQRLVQFVSECH